MADIELPLPPRRERVPWLPLLLIVAVAVLLRYPGLKWGLPDSTHIFSYHPDEFHSLRGALSLILAGDPNPHFFNYGSLYLYLVSIASVLADSGAVGNVSADGMTQLLHDWTLAARHLNLVMAAATVVAVFFIGRVLLGEKLGLVAAGALAVFPLHALHSRYATVDVPQALFLTLALLYAVRIGQRPLTRDYLLAGLFAGLAASTKYNGAVVLIAPLIAHLVARRDDEGGTVRLFAVQPLAMLVMAAAAFILTSPYTLLDWDSARRDILFEMQHMRLGEEPARSADPNGWLFHGLGLFLATGGGALTALMGLAGITVRRLWRPALGVVVFGACWFAMISMANVRYGRYEVALLPVIALLLAAAPACLYRRRVEVRLIGVLLPGACLLAALTTSLWFAQSLRQQPDPRDVALRTIMQVAPPDRPVGLVWEPWFNAPPVDRCNGGQALRSNPFWGQFKSPVRPLLVTGLDPAALKREQPFVLALSNFETRDALRVRDANAEAFMAFLRTEYLPAVVSERRAPLAGMLGWEPPQDWLYAFPQETVYLRRAK